MGQDNGGSPWREALRGVGMAGAGVMITSLSTDTPAIAYPGPTLRGPRPLRRRPALRLPMR
jgi:hypothetical protein